jgi:formylglycine-generating enzyme required for sulfatase activity
LSGGRAGDGGIDAPIGIDAPSVPRDADIDGYTSPPIDGGADAGTGEDMVFIPAGPFTMGCTSTKFCYPDEEPPRMITLSAFWADRTEVTRMAYRECVRAGACVSPIEYAIDLDDPTRLDHPVYGVTWDQADGYCRWRGARLPTEAQWERVARGTDGRFYPWGNDPPTCERANFTVNPPAPPTPCVGDTSPVYAHPAGASPEGALDLCGNVWEWTSTPYSPTYYADAPATDPPDVPTGFGPSYRGGSFTSDTERLDTWLRYYDDGTAAHMRRRRGFRCVR